MGVSTKLASRLDRVSESKTLKMARISRELKAKGVNIISLSLGEPDFDTPQHVKDAAIEAIQKGFTKYPPVAGYLELREAIVAKFKRENNFHVTLDQIVVSTGAKQSLSNVIMSLIEEGDEVLIPAPFWVSYPEQVEMAGGTNRYIKTTVEDNFKITAKQLDDAITDKTRLFIFSSPSNPTGNIYTQSELAELAEVFKKYPNVVIISDEIYEHINFVGKHASLTAYDFLHDRLVVVNGVSKGFAMTGWRIGYIAAPVWIAKACEKIQGQVTSGTCTISQMAALCALSSSLEETYKMRDVFKSRRDYLVDRFSKMDGFKLSIPEGAFYLFLDISNFFGKKIGDLEIKTAEDFTMFILEHAQVAMVEGAAFGTPECVRISYAASDEQLTEAANRIEKAIKQLK